MTRGRYCVVTAPRRRATATAARPPARPVHGASNIIWIWRHIHLAPSSEPSAAAAAAAAASRGGWLGRVPAAAPMQMVCREIGPDRTGRPAEGRPLIRQIVSKIRKSERGGTTTTTTTDGRRHLARPGRQPHMARLTARDHNKPLMIYEWRKRAARAGPTQRVVHAAGRASARLRTTRPARYTMTTELPRLRLLVLVVMRPAGGPGRRLMAVVA